MKYVAQITLQPEERNRVTRTPKTSPSQYERPADLLWGSEGIRAASEVVAFWASLPELVRIHDGDGHPVLVLPGFLTDDHSTAHLRGLLRSAGYRTSGWQLGANLGPTAQLWHDTVRQVEQLHESTGKAVSLIGQSLGGVFARELARHLPGHVRQVITLGSPFRLTSTDPRVIAVGRLYETLSWMHIDAFDKLGPKECRDGLNVPTTSIYSKLDGVVPWRACLDVDRMHAENVEVFSSHCGMAFDPVVLRIILNRLALPEGSLTPYREDIVAVDA
jgi:pimeloyl-ACP methyl ester carboxylesterase